MFSTAGATSRQFKRVQGLRGGPTRLKTSGKDYFDLTPDEDQKLIVETVEEFAEEILRPAAHDADEATTYPPDLVAKAAELGITAVNVPEDFDGIAAQRSSVTNVAGRRGAGLRRHGAGPADPGPGRRRRRADPLGQRRPAGHLPQGIRRRERAAGLRGHRRAAAAVRPHRAEDHGGAHAERLPARRSQVTGPGGRQRRAVRRRRPTQRQARVVHRRVRRATA